MTFTAYIERQKWLIRERHEGETFLICKDGCIPIRQTDEILSEMEKLDGLNKRTRNPEYIIKR
jgi:hypothetical protein